MKPAERLLDNARRGSLGVGDELPPLPPMATVLKSKDVEDPVNIWVHRPLAYGFVAATYRTSLTPNMITFLAMLVGVASAAFMMWGTSAAMVVAGVLLWSSAILDGADGILARAKGIQSQFGRALDGTADAIVAGTTVAAAVYHLYATGADTLLLWLCFPTVYMTVFHMQLYDFYKESYLRATRVGRGGEGEDAEALQRHFGDLSGVGLVKWVVLRVFFIPFVKNGERLVRWTNSAGAKKGLGRVATERSAAIYRKHNYGPMQMWALISLAPHSYLMAIFMMMDRLDIYFWFRLVGANAILALVILWQRVATRRTLSELDATTELAKAA